MIIPAKGQLSGKFIKCEICDKEVYFTPSRINKNKHFYCSAECSAVGSHNQGSETRICEQCGNTFVSRRSTPQRFCSVDCQHEWQKSNTKERNPRYKRVVHNCDYCGRPHTVKKYKLSQDNLFCSTSCRQKWYSNVWSQSKEWKEASRKRAVKMLSDGKISRTNSKPQMMVDDILDQIKIKYVREKPFGAYSVDNYIVDEGLCIEVMGDFWHTNPIKYGHPKYKKQDSALRRDIKKREYIKEATGCYPLYLWESDIVHNQTLCKLLIQHYIFSKGDIQNYNSLNYETDGQSVFLKNEIIMPFQEYESYTL